jgi:hypothetical protein
MTTQNISDSEIPPAKARRAPSSDNYFLCGLCVFAGDIPNLWLRLLPRCVIRDLFENMRGGEPGSVLVRLLDSVIPAWSAGIQADMDVSGRILRIWMPAIHAGMTKLSVFMLCRRT